jgi:glycosyltransferase involved in cell wall biosynthesis
MLNHSSPLVSVILAVRNGESYVAEALDSVLASDYRPLEIVVVDGQSSDRTADIVQSYETVRYVYQHNLGIANAYNLGIEAAQGEFVAFISHDDRWLPQKLSTQMAYLQAHPKIQYTVTQFRYFLATGCGLPPGFRPELLDRDLVGYIMETLVARKSVFTQVGMFNPHYQLAEDVDWYARAKDLQIPAAVIPAVLLHKRVHDHNSSTNARVSNQALLQVLRQSIQRQKAAPQ